jgi:hypothetical protein
VPSEIAAKDQPLCTVTRLGFATRRSAWRAWWRFRRLRALGHRHVPGLIVSRMAFLDARTVVFLSVWRDELSIFQFTTLNEHVEASRWVMQVDGAVWSGTFPYAGTSSLSTPWIGELRRWQPASFIGRRGIPVDENGPVDRLVT